jgi:hypothetical protein
MQQATLDQAAALRARRGWVSQSLKIAKVALRGNSALLGKLGLTVRMEKIPVQRSTKAAATRNKKKERQQKVA